MRENTSLVGALRNEENKWKSLYKHIWECYRRLMGYNPRDKWRKRSNCHQMLHFQTLGCKDSQLWKQVKNKYL